MKILVFTAMALFAVNAGATQNLDVVAKPFSTALNCHLEDMDVGYREPVFETATVCDFQDWQTFLSKVKAEFSVILKVEGLDGFSSELVKHAYSSGVHVGQPFRIQITGILN